MSSSPTLIILITASPHSLVSLNGLNHARQALAQGQKILKIFFFQDGVYHASDLIYQPNHELNMSQKWADFANENKLDLLICRSSAIRRGILDEQSAQHYGKKAANLHSAYQMSGLTQLMEDLLVTDHFVQFGI